MNPNVVLYHGTTEAYAASVCSGVIVDFSKVVKGRDFGLGFYTTTSEWQAREWARDLAENQPGTVGRIVRLILNRNALGNLSTLGFVRGNKDAEDYWAFIRSCRSGFPHRSGASPYYDVVYGPVAASWDEPKRSYVFDNYDQIGFHTKRAQDVLNDRNLCTKEILNDR